VHVTDEDIQQIVTDIWFAMLDLPVEPGDPSVDGAGTRSMAATVQITGDWDGGVELHFPATLAVTLTSAMLGMEEAEVSADDVRDVLGELANVAGGNLKTLAPGSCRLSLPTVTEGTDLHVEMPGGETIARVAFECAGHPFTVAVVGRAA
jgi:chemotaxis protein CheX